uniref:Phosphofurin acidic cluster sorting protein 2 n=1 Tax=Trichuris muris TaxID=70415 RepID=A0A5S6R4D5_TRIMR
MNDRQSLELTAAVSCSVKNVADRQVLRCPSVSGFPAVRAAKQPKKLDPVVVRTPADNMEQCKIVPMRLIATWEVDRACANSVPRLCYLSFSRLTIFRSLEQGASNLVIAVKLQGFKRTLRSNDMLVVPVNGIVDVDLDVEFTLQYPHFVKQRSNRLTVMLQRRKKYKNRPMLGYKTLAAGAINLTDVLQRVELRELNLYSDEAQADPSSKPAARLCILSLSSQPIDQEDSKLKGEQSGEYSDEEDEEWTGNEEGGASDSEPIVDDQPIGAMTPSNSWLKSSQQVQHSPIRFALHQKNIKQKFIALLKKFRVPEEESTECGFGKKPARQELEALFEELESMTDSGGEQENDTASVRSTPKPSLRTYFPSREKLPIVPDEGSDESKDSIGCTTSFDFDSPRNNDRTTADSSTLAEHWDKFVDPDRTPSTRICSAPLNEWSVDPGGLKGRPSVAHQNSAPLFETRKLAKSSAVATTKDAPTTSTASVPCIAKSAKVSGPSGARSFSEQLRLALSADDAALPSRLFILSSRCVNHCSALLQLLESCRYCSLVTETLRETKSVFCSLVGNIQRFCNQNSASPPPVQVCLLGGDEFFNNCLRSYTEVFGQKPNDWLGYVRFYPVACCGGIWLRYLSSMDRGYFSLFGQSTWLDLWDKSALLECERKDVLDRIHRYLCTAKFVLPLTISEVMIHLKSESSNNELTQQFVPFVVSVKLAPVENAPESSTSSTDFTNVSTPSPTAAQSASSSASSNAATCGRPDLNLQSSSPPGSPHSNDLAPDRLCSYTAGTDAKELQIEYWATSNLPCLSVGSSMTPTALGVAARPDGASAKRENAQSANQAKCTMKTAFRSLTVTKSAPNPVALLNESSTLPLSLLAFHFVKEKKKDKVLQKLGMKNKDKAENEPRTHTIDGISRFICSTKQHSRINLRIDGVEWRNVKFFQISALWQTHVKFFPVGVFQLETFRESS